MKAEYTSDELLPLSGIQHFLFCRRQWALIYVEQQWQDNVLTVEGKLLHQKADDPYFVEVRKDLIVARAVPVSSHQLGLSGVCDVVEFRLAEDGVILPGRQGKYLPAPVEYKRGKEKQDHSDSSQLCAQAMCLEDMLSVDIPVGYLYYHQTRRRVEVELDTVLRSLVTKMSLEMHEYFRRGHTPKTRPFKGCRSCSMLDICLPNLGNKRLHASQYIRAQLEG